MVEPDVRQYPELARHPLQVRPDLGLTGEAIRPVRLERERERVEMRLDVARAPGIRVVAPCSADVICALEDDEVVDAGPLQPNRRAQTTETTPDDRNPGMHDRRVFSLRPRACQ